MNAQTPLFILHGWSIEKNGQDKWLPFIAELKKVGLNPQFLALPGLQSPLNEVWNLDNYVEWVTDKLPNQPVVLLGHSFGGQIAIRLAARHPEKVSQLILIDSAGLRDHAVLPTAKRVVFKLAAKIGKVFLNNQLARMVLYKLAREKDYYNAPPLLRRTMSSVLDEELWEELPKVQAPTLIIWGSDDRVTPIKLGRQIHQLIAQSRIEVVTGARHAPMFTHTAQTAQLVSEFIKGKA
jgi:pimeloyl-ACP methyl ester carboxylesterase